MLPFRPMFSMQKNTISDLGNTVCGNYNGSLVCSPYHSLMNLSFVLLGLTMFFGAALQYKLFKASRRNAFGFIAIATGGIGTILVGLFPENTIGALHVLGAALPFLLGNSGILLLGFSLKLPKLLRYYTILTGVLTLLALVLYVTSSVFWLGKGGMERLVSYPQTLWLAILGIYCLLRTQHTNTEPGIK